MSRQALERLIADYTMLLGDGVIESNEPEILRDARRALDTLGDFAEWWDAHREGSPNAAYWRVDRFVREIRRRGGTSV